MKPTREQAMQIAREAGLDVRGGDILPHYRGGVSEGYLDLIDAAYAAGAEKGKEAYEREHLRHTAPLPDALRVMQEQVAEACIKVIEHHKIPVGNSPAGEIACRLTYGALNDLREEIRAGEWRAHLGET